MERDQEALQASTPPEWTLGLWQSWQKRRWNLRDQRRGVNNHRGGAGAIALTSGGGGGDCYRHLRRRAGCSGEEDVEAPRRAWRCGPWWWRCCWVRRAACGSAQITFNATKFVEVTVCNETVVLPCIANHVYAESLKELFVKWKFKGKEFFLYNGARDESRVVNSNFSSAEITPSELLNGHATLRIKKSEAVLGNYTCEITALAREGETIIELRYRVVSWFSPKENILIVIFPILAILLSWGQFGIVTLKYTSNRTNEKTILMFVAGLLLTIVVIIGAIIFIPGEYSIKNASGLGLIVIPTVILILLQYCAFMTAFGMTYFAIAILIIQVLGYILAVVGISLCVSECTPVQGPLLISGLGIIALAELLGLVYMKFVASNQKTIQPPRKAVEEPLNAFKESKGMMNDEVTFNGKTAICTPRPTFFQIPDSIGTTSVAFRGQLEMTGTFALLTSMNRLPSTVGDGAYGDTPPAPTSQQDGNVELSLGMLLTLQGVTTPGSTRHF
ncbi:PREDICTED: leukocyte surface antigen CD47 [Chrysochloris asiatica]|uniref:Leukocyte surface antigen CD47 n=1 Tax=Chrysochloris asiatica TaxID=185453 RepID=A0A9B0TZ50_CHRAS|nr:PREDICTED: leukocyte surface antigen CD47 [Chrysochloris asiatica]